MRKLLLAAFVLVSGAASAQNLQLHYDLKSPRQYFTSTLEQFKPDAWGSTFYFVDFDYDASKKNPSSAYMEISRNLKLGSCPIMAHAEFNGGLLAKNSFGLNFKNAALFGGAYSFMVGGWILESQVMYKAIQGNESPNFQLTQVWTYPMFNGRLIFSGFIDVWSEDKEEKLGAKDPKKIVLLTEPQLWLNINKTFAVGSEVEISNNFVYGENKVQVFPTVAVKYTF
jgi:hypothetical protein